MANWPLLKSSLLPSCKDGHYSPVGAGIPRLSADWPCFCYKTLPSDCFLSLKSPWYFIDLLASATAPAKLLTANKDWTGSAISKYMAPKVLCPFPF